jgi:hypothetical protein
MGYILVNPKLSNSSIKSQKKNSSEAAEDIWSKLSSNIKNYTPKFYFTIQEAGSSDLSHFVIKESIEGDKVKYNLKEFKGKKIDDNSLLKELKQEGGRRKHKYYDDDDSSSSSSSSSELIFTFPAGKTHKDLLLTYYPTIYGVPNVVLPTFVSSFVPFTNIKLLPNILFIP